MPTFAFKENQVSPTDAGSHPIFRNNDEPESLIIEDLVIYLYPNQHGGDVYIKDLDLKSHEKKRTSLTLPPWILQNAVKSLAHKRKHVDDSSHALEADTMRRKQEEKMNRLSEDLKSLNKDMEMIKSEVQGIASFLRNSRK